MKQLRALCNVRMLVVFLMGFSSGLPLLLIGSTLKAWMGDAKIDLTTIGIFSLVGIPFNLKFVWSPLLDRYVPPFLGRRRGWLLISQVGLIVALLALSLINPAETPVLLAGGAVLIAFLAATQDIALDAYRREYLTDIEFAFGNSLAITGYRFGMMFAGAGALLVADAFCWQTAYQIMAAGVLIGLATTLFASEPKVLHPPPRTIQEAVIEPFKEFFQRSGAVWILLFVLLYKVGDQMASEMTMNFYLNVGFTKTQIAGVVKLFGVWAIIGGGLIGGAAILRIGLYRALWIFGILQAVATFGFAWLSRLGPNLYGLTAAITAENLTAGMGSAAYTAFMAKLTNKRFTATQYALLSSMMTITSRFLGPPSGWMAQHLGWEVFFSICVFSSIPGLLILFKIKHLTRVQTEEDVTDAATVTVSASSDS